MRVEALATLDIIAILSCLGHRWVTRPKLSAVITRHLATLRFATVLMYYSMYDLCIFNPESPLCRDGAVTQYRMAQTSQMQKSITGPFRHIDTRVSGTC